MLKVGGVCFFCCKKEKQERAEVFRSVHLGTGEKSGLPSHVVFARLVMFRGSSAKQLPFPSRAET